MIRNGHQPPPRDDTFRLKEGEGGGDKRKKKKDRRGRGEKCGGGDGEEGEGSTTAWREDRRDADIQTGDSITTH